MKKTIHALLCAGLMASLAAAGPALEGETLKVGDAAPALSVAEWVKGAPAETLAKGQVYMIEFWATW